MLIVAITVTTKLTIINVVNDVNASEIKKKTINRVLHFEKLLMQFFYVWYIYVYIFVNTHTYISNPIINTIINFQIKIITKISL